MPLLRWRCAGATPDYHRAYQSRSTVHLRTVKDVPTPAPQGVAPLEYTRPVRSPRRLGSESP